MLRQSASAPSLQPGRLAPSTVSKQVSRTEEVLARNATSGPLARETPKPQVVPPEQPSSSQPLDVTLLTKQLTRAVDIAALSSAQKHGQSTHTLEQVALAVVAKADAASQSRADPATSAAWISAHRMRCMLAGRSI